MIIVTTGNHVAMHFADQILIDRPLVRKLSDPPVGVSSGVCLPLGPCSQSRSAFPKRFIELPLREFRTLDPGSPHNLHFELQPLHFLHPVPLKWRRLEREYCGFGLDQIIGYGDKVITDPVPGL
jgi:hypothetical protein